MDALCYTWFLGMKSIQLLLAATEGETKEANFCNSKVCGDRFVAEFMKRRMEEIL